MQISTAQTLGPQTQATLVRLSQEKLFAIVRTTTADEALWASATLLKTGFSIIEIPFTVPDAARVIETLVDRFPEAVIGAGTVLDARQAVSALGAGAGFLVSPVLIEPLIHLGAEHDVLVLPGCMTPSEIYHAAQLGAPAIKVFPAQSAGGTAFLQAVRGPLPNISLIPTGGISREDVPAYLKAGALAVGVGGPILSADVLNSRNENLLRETALAYLKMRDI